MKSNIPKVLKYSVEGINWDITSGAAKTALGKMFLSATSSSSKMIPETVDHVGIIAYGQLYEYGDQGILISSIPVKGEPISKYDVKYIRNREILGDTKVLYEEFEAWVKNLNLDEYAGSSYNAVDHSCVVWARKACQYLKVPHPENWDKICDWAESNKTFTKIAAR